VFIAAKHHIEPRALATRELAILLSIETVEPASPHDGDQLVVRYVLTNFTLEHAAGVTTGAFQGQDLQAPGGAPPTTIDLEPGRSLTASLRTTTPIHEGSSRVQLAYKDKLDCRKVPDPKSGKVRTVCLPGVSASASQIVTVTRDESQTDGDADGIPDAVERALLARFTPFLRFSDRNGPDGYRPMDALNYVRWSELQTVGDEGEGVIITNARLSTDPNALLGENGESDVTITPQFRKGDRYLNPLKDVPQPDGDWARHGWAWPDVLATRNVGLYGHVVPFRATPPQTAPLRCLQSGRPLREADDWVQCGVDRGSATARTYYKVEYWQFFGYSDSAQGFDIADHEADWCTVQVLFDPEADTLLQVHHSFHGRNAGFDLRAAVDVVDLDGGDVREYRGLNFPREVGLTWHEGPAADVKNEIGRARSQQNVVRLKRDAATGRYEHPVVYVEHGAHEFWPTEAWAFDDAPNHDGDDADHSYLAAPPPNLGEVEAPLAEVAEARLVLRYNGRWGAFSHKNDPPQGPALHNQWTWPEGSKLREKLPPQLEY
jgi:hypothetical protein